MKKINRKIHRSIFFQVLTRDSVTVSVDAVVYYRVSNATVSVANVENVSFPIQTTFYDDRIICTCLLKKDLTKDPLISFCGAA